MGRASALPGLASLVQFPDQIEVDIAEVVGAPQEIVVIISVDGIADGGAVVDESREGLRHGSTSRDGVADDHDAIGAGKALDGAEVEERERILEELEHRGHSFQR